MIPIPQTMTCFIFLFPVFNKTAFSFFFTISGMCILWICGSCNSFSYIQINQLFQIKGGIFIAESRRRGTRRRNKSDFIPSLVTHFWDSHHSCAIILLFL
jgi:hypothetical protein